MLIRDFLKTLTNRRKLNARRRLARPHDLSEQLESRTLLTGNVQVSLIGANAQISGDAANNEIEVVVNIGSVVVRGLNGTTINQGSTAFTLANASTTFHGSLTASLGAGDDAATIGPGITFAGNVSVSGNGGADSLRALTGTYNGNLSLMGGNGASSIVVDGATVSGNLSVNGQGAMVVSITNSTVRGQLDVATGLENSPDSVVIKGTTVNKKTSIVTGRGDDNVALQNSHFNGQLIMYTGAGNDVVYIDSSSVGKLALIATQRGDDTLQVLNSSSFSRLLLFAGGVGHDAANIASDTLTHGVIKGSQKSKYFSAATVASRITDATTGAIAVANALRNAAVPSLTLAATPATISENSGATASKLRITRTGPTTAAQLVTLTSSNTNKATVSTTATIPIGATFAEVDIAAVDNQAVDGAVAVTFTASADGFAPTTTVVTVNDNETALSLNAAPATFAESAGTTASTLTVTRTGSSTAAQVVNLTSSNTNAATVPATVTIPAGSTTATVSIAAVNNSAVTGPVSVIISAAATGFAVATTTLTVNDAQTVLSLSANPTTFAENSGTAASTLTVTRTGPTTSALVVSLSSSDESHARVALPTVTIPTGQTSATIAISAIDDQKVNGNAAVTITAAATGFANATRVVTVANTNSPTLTVTSNATTVSESAAPNTLLYTVTRNTTDNALPVTVALSSNLTARLGVPGTVIIAAGATSATFFGTPVNDTIVNGNSPAVVSASATGFAAGTSTVTITDNDAGTLALTSSAASIAENAGADALTFTITRTSIDITQPLVLTLSSSNTSRLTVGNTVTIPANQTSVTFKGSPVDNMLVDTGGDVVVTAVAVGFNNAIRTVTINNTDVATLKITSNSLTVAENGGVDALVYTVSRNTSDNTLPLTFSLASSLPSRLANVGTYVIEAGQSSRTIPGAPVNNGVADGNADVTLTVSATGFVPGTAMVTVVDDEPAVLTVTADKSSVFETVGVGAVTYTVARNTTNNTQPLIVNLVSGTPGRLTVPGTVTIPAGQSSVTFDGATIDTPAADGNVPVVIRATATGFTDGTASVTVKDNDAATLTVTPTTSTISENYQTGAFFYTATRNSSDLSQPVTVNLTSNNIRLGVPATITIPAGSASKAFQVTPVNNAVADGNADVTLTAKATGFADALWNVNVIDDEAATQPPFLSTTLTVSSLLETSPAESTFLKVTRSASDPTNALVVNLTYSNTSRVSGPATITIPAGGTEATVPLSTIDNLIVDGNIDEDISATAVGFESSQITLRISDNEGATLSLTTTASTVAEDSGTLAGTVTTSVASSAPIVVSMSYQFSSVLTGPAVVVIPAGETSVPVTFTINNGSVTDQNVVSEIFADAFGAVSGMATVTITDADSIALSATANATDAVQSNGTIITRSSMTQVTGATVAGATISIDSDGDGVFDNGTATAGIDGTYSVDVNVTNTSTNHGENRLVVRAVNGPDLADTAVNVHRAIGTVVHFATNAGAYDVELLDSEAGATVTNFLSYVTSGAYQNMFVHRANAGSAKFMQGGSFKVTNSQITSVATTGTIDGQFNPANGNVAGTLAMALTAAGPNSGTSGWFVNAIDNSAAFDGGEYTVFGRVIGDGLTVVKQISDLSQANLNTLYSSSALASVPLNANPANTSITGTVATASGSTILTGTGTLFTSQLTVGESVVLGTGKAFFVSSIQSDTSLTLTQSATSTASGLAVKKHVVPTDAEFVVFSSIGKILDTL